MMRRHVKEAKVRISANIRESVMQVLRDYAEKESITITAAIEEAVAVFDKTERGELNR